MAVADITIMGAVQVVADASLLDRDTPILTLAIHRAGDRPSRAEVGRIISVSLIFPRDDADAWQGIQALASAINSATVGIASPLSDGHIGGYRTLAERFKPPAPEPAAAAAPEQFELTAPDGGRADGR